MTTNYRNFVIWLISILLLIGSSITMYIGIKAHILLLQEISWIASIFILLALLIALYITKPDTVRSLLKSEVGLDLYELGVAVFMTSKCNFDKNQKEEALVDSIKKELANLYLKFDVIHENSLPEAGYPTFRPNVSKEGIIKKAIQLYLRPKEPDQRFLTHYKVKSPSRTNLVHLPFYSYDFDSHTHYKNLSSYDKVTDEYLKKSVANGVLVSIGRGVPIETGEALYINPDESIFIAKNY